MQMPLPFLESKSEDLPVNEIVVLGKTFSIRILEPGERDDADGLMELQEQRISIRPQPALQYNQDTILHETIHAIDEILRLRLKENQVHQLAAGLMSVFKQNKDFTEWMLK